MIMMSFTLWTMLWIVLTLLRVMPLKICSCCCERHYYDDDDDDDDG